MIVGLLIALAIVLAIGAPKVLNSLNGIQERPKLGLLAWHSAIVTTFMSLIIAGLVAAHDFWEPIVVFAYRANPELVHHQYSGSSPVGHAWNLGLVVVGLLGLRLCWVWIRQVRVRRGEAAMLRGGVTEILHENAGGAFSDVTFVDLPESTAFCIPGAKPMIVVSRRAVAALTPRELTAVVEHEREHLRAHHAAQLGFAQALVHAFPFWSFAKQYSNAVAQLHEMQADDVAVLATDSRTVVQALLALSAPASGARPAMAAGDVSARGTRLLRQGVSSIWASRIFPVVTLAVVLVPFAFAVVPGIGIANSGHSVDGRPGFSAPYHP